ncbi:fumarylacetoacetase [Nostocoides vanveenii]|uniref:fumarylacetoacetase n=1 Tax=Nostocoides vanveenii TaxID=330835 RepID=A0ABP4X924_9MICO
MDWWHELPADEPFGLANLPYAVADFPDGARVVARIADHALDLARCAEHAGMESGAVWDRPSLNAFLAEGPASWAAARTWLQDTLRDQTYADCVAPHLHPLDGLDLLLPLEVADYVDFYASEHHATNVGELFRPGQPALTPNWKHLPIGYHGRSGTVVVSGTDVVRPCGQRKGPNDPEPVFGPSVRLDIECELGFVVGGSSAIGEPIALDRAWEHIFGVVLLNDWSARDIQAWEYAPLGPFLGKSFATSISAWVVPMAALSAAHVPLPAQDPAPLPYLRGDAATGLDISCAVTWNDTLVSTPPFAQMYWSPAQMLAHLSVNGASTRPGDLFGSGTISGPAKETRGSFLELSWNGAEPVTLGDGSTRSFLQDGDTITLTATAPGPGGSVIGFGACTGTIRPALTSSP